MFEKADINSFRRQQTSEHTSLQRNDKKRVFYDALEFEI